MIFLLLSKPEIFRHYLAAVVVQPGLYWTWSATPKPGFLAMRLICFTDIKKEPEKNKVFSCEFCPKTFRKRYRCTYHMKNMHSKDQPTDTVCHICDKRFSCKTSVRTHIAIVHMQMHRFQCDTCAKLFGRKKDLIDHERQHHSVKNQLKCKKCGASFGYTSSFNRHQLSCGKTEKDHKCSVCNKYFLSSNALYGHKKAKHSNQLHVCEICGRSFERRSSYVRHVKDVHTRNKEPEIKHNEPELKTGVVIKTEK